MMKKAVVYIHGKGGSREEAAHYRNLFPGYEVIGFDYSSQTPWEAQKEFPLFFEKLQRSYAAVTVIANSIGAFFAIHGFKDMPIEKALLISPIVDMEKLISDMMRWAGVTEQELAERKRIETSFGETLSMEYLTWVRENPTVWQVPTAIVYGEKDHLQSIESVKSFAEKTGAVVTVMENGEHWFHTEEQMAFLNRWIQSCIAEKK